jgi:hypothetical protein
MGRMALKKDGLRAEDRVEVAADMAGTVSWAVE